MNKTPDITKTLKMKGRDRQSQTLIMSFGSTMNKIIS